MPTLARTSVKTARDEDLVATIAEITGLAPSTVKRRLNQAHGRTYLRTCFEDRWPASPEAFEGKTAAWARDHELFDELAQVTGLIARTVKNRLQEAAGKTHVQNVFADHWGAAGEDADADVASDPSARSEAAKRPRRKKNGNGRTELPPEAKPGEKLSLPQLERHLWGAADILRGSIDSGDFKHYIFGLLFFKRLCDVWQEEYEALLAEFDGDEEEARSPDEHRFYIPAGNLWSDVRKKSKDIGDAINHAFREIEDANPRLFGIFQDVDFANKERFPDATLEKLVAHFDRHRLRKSDVAADMLGDAYLYLIAKFADDAGKKGGEFYTPHKVVQLMVECLRPEEGMAICDPACGSGGMLLECHDYMRRNGKDARTLVLYGQEKNLNTWAICKMNLFLHDIDVQQDQIARGDTLVSPKHLAGDKALKKFDIVLANPPFSLSPWGHEVWSKGDSYGRDAYGCPPKSYADLAFVQHMVATLKDKGRMAVVVPHGVLFRGGTEGTIRQGLLEADLIEAVVGLGQNLFYGTGIPAAILFINKNKPASRRGKVLLVNGDKDFVPGKNQNTLSDENVARLVGAVRRFEDQELFCRVVPLEEIAANDYNLNLTRYVQTDEPPPPIDVKSEVEKLRALMVTRDETEARMRGYLRELGYE